MCSSLAQNMAKTQGQIPRFGRSLQESQALRNGRRSWAKEMISNGNTVVQWKKCIPSGSSFKVGKAFVFANNERLTTAESGESCRYCLKLLRGYFMMLLKRNSQDCWSYFHAAVDKQFWKTHRLRDISCKNHSVNSLDKNVLYAVIFIIAAFDHSQQCGWGMWGAWAFPGAVVAALLPNRKDPSFGIQGDQRLRIS